MSTLDTVLESWCERNSVTNTEVVRQMIFTVLKNTARRRGCEDQLQDGDRQLRFEKSRGVQSDDTITAIPPHTQYILHIQTLSSECRDDPNRDGSDMDILESDREPSEHDDGLVGGFNGGEDDSLDEELLGELPGLGEAAPANSSNVDSEPRSRVREVDSAGNREESVPRRLMTSLSQGVVSLSQSLMSVMKGGNKDNGGPKPGVDHDSRTSEVESGLDDLIRAFSPSPSPSDEVGGEEITPNDEGGGSQPRPPGAHGGSVRGGPRRTTVSLNLSRPTANAAAQRRLARLQASGLASQDMPHSDGIGVQTRRSRQSQVRGVHT